MRTQTWVVAGILGSSVTLGCTANSISLDDPGATDGATDGPSTWPPGQEDSTGSDDGPIPDCYEDVDCGGDFCSECVGGTCMEYPGCCSQVPDEPWSWHCSPPEECWEDFDCPDGQVCNFGFCEPGGSNIEQPPTCRDSVVLDAMGIDLGFVAQQIVGWGGSGLLVVDEVGQLVPVDLLTGPGAPLADLGAPVQELVVAGPSVIATHTLDDPGGELYTLVRAQDEGAGVWSVLESTPAPGRLVDTIFIEDTTQVLAAVSDRIDRWMLESLAPDRFFSLGGLDALAAVRTEPMGPAQFAAVSSRGLLVFDAVLGGTWLEQAPPTGSAVDLATGAIYPDGHGQDLVVLSQTEANPDTGEEELAVAQVFRVFEGTVTSILPFGAPGRAKAVAVADLDDSGVGDVVVSTDNSRVDVYLMTESGPLCRVHLAPPEVVDLVGGDFDGDGRADVAFSDASGMLTILWGSPKPAGG